MKSKVKKKIERKSKHNPKCTENQKHRQKKHEHKLHGGEIDKTSWKKEQTATTEREMKQMVEGKAEKSTCSHLVDVLDAITICCILSGIKAWHCFKVGPEKRQM